MRKILPIHQTRYKNARLILKETGSLRKMADRMGRADNYLSSIAGSNPKRNIGDQIARVMEDVFGKPSGWMDQEH